MIHRLFALAVVGVCLLGSPAQAQQAEAAGGPLRFAGGEPNKLNFVVGGLPGVRPSRPVEVWEWSFFRADRRAGQFTYDSAAYRVRIDCQAVTRQVVGAELFRDGAFLTQIGGSTDVTTDIAPGTLYHQTVQMACEPGFAAGRETAPDHGAARAATDRYFSVNP